MGARWAGPALAILAGVAARAQAPAAVPPPSPAAIPAPTVQPVPLPPPPSPASVRKMQQGDELLRTGDVRAAFFAYQEASNLDPLSAAVRMKLGDAYERLGYYDEAARQFDLAAALDPPGAEAARRGERARAARDGKAPPPQLAQPARPPAAAETPAASAYEQGVALVGKGRYAEAVASLDEAVRRDPRLPQAYTARASALFGLGRYLEAAGDYRTALALDPSQATPLFGLGECYRLLSQNGAALEHYQRYLESAAADVRNDLKAEAQRRVAELRPR